MKEKKIHNSGRRMHLYYKYILLVTRCFSFLTYLCTRQIRDLLQTSRQMKINIVNKRRFSQSVVTMLRVLF